MNFNCSCYFSFSIVIFFCIHFGGRLMTILCRRTIQNEINNSSNLHFSCFRFFLLNFHKKKDFFCSASKDNLLQWHLNYVVGVYSSHDASKMPFKHFEYGKLNHGKRLMEFIVDCFVANCSFFFGVPFWLGSFVVDMVADLITCD